MQNITAAHWDIPPFRDFLPWAVLEEKLKALELALNVNDVSVVRLMLEKLIPGYAPSGEIVDWVHLTQETSLRAKRKGID